MNKTDLLCSAVHFYILHHFTNDLILKNYIFNLFCDVYGERSDCYYFYDALNIVTSSTYYDDFLRSHNFS